MTWQIVYYVAFTHPHHRHQRGWRLRMTSPWTRNLPRKQYYADVSRAQRWYGMLWLLTLTWSRG